MKYNILLKLRKELVSTDKSVEFPITKNFLGENTGDFYMGWEVGPPNSKIQQFGKVQGDTTASYRLWY